MKKEDIKYIFAGIALVLFVFVFIAIVLGVTISLFNAVKKQEKIENHNNEIDIQRCLDNGMGYNRTWNGFIECTK